jgi:putative ATPase
MRPQSLDDFVGQRHFMYKGSLLYNAIRNHTFESAVFHGPSGTGKTTLARIVAREMDADFVEINASETGVKELRALIDDAKVKFFGLEKKQTYVYIDEFHRWNKLQQDSLLKALEDGVLHFIGSTTENPYFSVNNAVLSRVGQIYEFFPLDTDDIEGLLKRALADEKRGLGAGDIPYDEQALHILADMASGDARIALDRLGYIAENLDEGEKITKEIVAEAMQRQTTFYDRGDDKYNLLSALQKSVRGSDPDAAVHYLARLIEGGADVVMIGRRLLVMASEDVGMAYPQAIGIVTSCVQAAQMTGLPEASLNLAEAVVFMAACPKSNSAYAAYSAAAADLRSRNVDDVPNHLKDTHYKGAKDRGYGGYVYPHSFGGWVEQQYLPDNLYKEGVRYYEPTDHGREAAFKKYLEGLEALKHKKNGGDDGND